MKKSLIALAALATVGAAQAQSSVTIYGIVDTGYVSTENNTAGGAKVERTGIVAGNSTSGRLGFRGSEDLGGGLRAEFTAEGNLRASAAGSDLTGRQSFVTLRSNTAGAVHIGLLHSTNHLARTALDPFGGANLFGNINYNVAAMGSTSAVAENTTGFVTGETTTTSAATSYVTRGNAIAYEFPRFANTTLAISYAPGDNKSTANTGVVTNTTANALSARLVSNVTKELTVIAAYLDGAAKSGPAGAQTDVKNSTIGAIYNFGVAQLFVSRTDDKASGATLAANTVAYDKKVNTIGLTSTVGKIKYMAHYLDGELTTGGVARDQSGLKLGAEYNFSKRTAAYALYGQQEGQNAARTADHKDKGYAVGVRHSF